MLYGWGIRSGDAVAPGGVGLMYKCVDGKCYKDLLSLGGFIDCQRARASEITRGIGTGVQLTSKMVYNGMATMALCINYSVGLGCRTNGQLGAAKSDYHTLRMTTGGVRGDCGPLSPP